ncbi:hypothetical protein L218DRAFT_865644, partial [Marasmius fiardii PR-910]
KQIEALKSHCPALKLENTGSHSETITWDGHSLTIKPDIIAYHSSNQPKKKTDLSRAEFLFELKTNDSDPFSNIDTGRPNTITSTRSLDQISTYAGMIFSTQFRTHCFGVVIFGEYVRLVRWDRGGGTFSDKFHLWKDSLLTDFLWRYNWSDRETRGHDLCVCLLHEDDDEEKRRATRARWILDMGPNDKVYSFKVNDRKENGTFLGGKVAVRVSPNPTGRSTRGFYVTTLEATDLLGPLDRSSHVHYLKDTWRISLDSLTPEGEIYQKLHHHNVLHIPTILAAGDASGDWQKTVTGTIVPKRYGRPIRRHHHYFLVMKEVGLPLIKFTLHRQLVGALRDALKAHQIAYVHARVLHRDISVGNVLMFGRGGGLLIDWEFSKVVNPDIPSTPRQDERTGTWQFISARILGAAGKAISHTVTDDLESFYHVLCWVTVQYVNHQLSDADIVELLNRVYDYATSKNGKDAGGKGKKNAMVTMEFTKDVEIKCSVLRFLVKTIESVFKSHHRKIILNDIQTLIHQIETSSSARVTKLDTHDWMIDVFDVTATSLDTQPDDEQRRVDNRDPKSAVKEARSAEARENKKRTRDEYKRTESSPNASIEDEEDEDNSGAPSRKKPRNLASRSTSRICQEQSNPQHRPSSLSKRQSDVEDDREDGRPRKRIKSGNEHQLWDLPFFAPPSSNHSNGGHLGRHLRARSENGSISLH